MSESAESLQSDYTDFKISADLYKMYHEIEALLVNVQKFKNLPERLEKSQPV